MIKIRKHFAAVSIIILICASLASAYTSGNASNNASSIPDTNNMSEFLVNDSFVNDSTFSDQNTSSNVTPGSNVENLANVTSEDAENRSSVQNNTSSETETALSAMPDLVVTTIETPESLYLNSSNAIDVTVGNIGELNITTPFNVSLKANETEIDNKTINILQTDESITINFTWAPLNTGSYYLTAIADSENVINESNETNNRYTINVTVIKEPKPDLIVKEIQTPDKVYSNVSNTIAATIENIGNVNTSVFNVKFNVNDTVLCVKTVTALSAASNTTLSFDWTPVHAGNYTLNVTADSNDEIIELNETNNERRMNITVFDISQTDLLVVEIETEMLFAKELNPVKARIKNAGRDASSFDVSLRVNETLVDTKRVSSLAFNTKTVVVFGWVPGEAGSYTLNITVDSNNETIEENETNNWLEKAVSVIPAPSWDHIANITIHSSKDLGDYQILLTLDPSIFDYNLTREYGEDITFRDDNNLPLPYWVEEWNRTGESFVWIRLNVPDNGKTITMPYGNPSVPSRSCGYLVFDFYDGFEEGLDGWLKRVVYYSDGTCNVTLVNDTPDNSEHAACIEVKRVTRIVELYKNMTLHLPYYFDFSMKVKCDKHKPEAGAFIGNASADKITRIYATENTSSWQRHSTDISNWTGQTVDIGFYGMNSWWRDYHVNISIDNARLRKYVEREPFVDYEYADIVPTKITPRFADLYANFTNQIYVSVANNGTADARDFNVSLFANDTEIDTMMITVSHKSNKTIEFGWTPSHEGNYTLNVVTDTEYAVAETNETNNNVILRVSVKPPLTWGYAFVEDLPITYHGVNLANCSILITLDPANFDYSKALPDGADIRIKDENGTDLPYWIENWNTTGKSYIWVRLDVPDGGRTIYLCYGNRDAVYAGDEDARVGLFEDWEDENFGYWVWDKSVHWDDSREIVNIPTIAHGGAHSLKMWAWQNYPDTYGYSYNRLYKNISIKSQNPVFNGWLRPEKFAGLNVTAMYMLDVNVSNTTYQLCYGAFNYVPEDTFNTFYFNPFIGADQRWHQWHGNIRYDLEAKGVNVTGEIDVTKVTLYNKALPMEGQRDGETAYYDDLEIRDNPAIADVGYADLEPSSITSKLNRFYANYTRNPIVVTVENKGTADARDFNISLYLNNEPFGTKTISVPHKTTRSFAFSWTPPHAGNYTMHMEVDTEDVVNETDELNNNLTTMIHVNPDFSWRYNDTVPIRYHGEGLENVSVLITLEPSLFNYSQAQHDGGDVRFKDANGTELPYGIEAWNVTGESYIWVRFNVPDGGTEIQMWYGCEDVLSESNVSTVAAFIEDWNDGNMVGWVCHTDNRGAITESTVYNQTLWMYSKITEHSHHPEVCSWVYKDISLKSADPFFSGWLKVEKLDTKGASVMYIINVKVVDETYELSYAVGEADGKWHHWHCDIRKELEDKGITVSGEIQITKITHYITDVIPAFRDGHEIIAYFDDLVICSSPPNITIGYAELSPTAIMPFLDYVYVKYPNRIFVNITNNGPADARGFDVALYANDKLIDTANISELMHNSAETIEFVWVPDSTGNHSLRVVVDPQNRIEESDEENNCRTIEVRVVERDMPDLTLQAVRIPEQIRLNRSATIEAVIENLGTSVGISNLELYVDGTFIENRTIKALQTGETTMINITWIPNDAGNHTLKIALDPANVIAELNEENNNETIEITVVAPDLTLKVEEEPHEYHLNCANNVKVRVANNGTAPAEGFNVSFRVNGAGEKKRIEMLNKGETKALSFDWVPSELGNHTLRIEVDSEHEIDESNEGNNTLMWNVQVIEAPESDIAIINVTTKERFYAGTANMIYVWVENRGTRNASFNITLYEDGTHVEKRIDNLSAHTSTSIRFAWIPHEVEENLPKDCTLRIEADSGHEINESNEDDNLWSNNVTLEYIEVPPSSLLVHGNVSYKNRSKPCTAFRVNITKKNETFEADTLIGFSRYLSILGIYPNDTYPEPGILKMNATDGASTNRTEHTITEEEVGDGTLVQHIILAVLQPDLYVVESIVLPAECYLNKTHLINATIENSGLSVNQSFNVSFIVNDVTKERKRVNSLNITENKTLSFNWTPKKVGKYNLTVFIDSDREINESNEYNNNLTIVGATATAPDLEVITAGIEPPYDLFVNLSNTINVTIKNIGDAPADNSFDTKLFVCRENDTNEKEVAKKWIESLNISENKTLCLNWTPSQVGRYNLTIVLDTGNWIAESNETNNEEKITREVYEPMEVAMVLVSGTGDTYFKQFKAPLNGTAYYATVKACILIGEWNDPCPVFTDGDIITRVAGIDDPYFFIYSSTNQSWVESPVNTSSPSLTEGTIFGWTSGVEPPPLPLPELTPTEMRTPRTLYKGRTIPVTVTVENNGIADAEAVVVRLNVKREGENDWKSEEDITAICADGNTTVTLKWLASDVGTYELRFIVDPANRVNETDESNNEINMSVKVVRGLIIDVPVDFKTIQEAVEDAAPDSVIYVHEGRYGGFSAINKHNISLIGDGWETEVVDATINIINSSDITIDGFNMVNTHASASGAHIGITNSRDIVINDCKLRMRYNGAIYLYNSSSCRISDCLIHFKSRHYEYTDLWSRWYKPPVYIAADSSDNLIVNNTLCQVPFGIRVEGDNNRIYHNNLYQTHYDGWNTRMGDRKMIASDSGQGNRWDYNYWARYCVYFDRLLPSDIPNYDDYICIGDVCYTHFSGSDRSGGWCHFDYTTGKWICVYPVSGDAWAKSYDMLDTDGDGIRDLPYSAPDPQYGNPAIDHHPLIEPWGVNMDASIEGAVIPNRIYTNRTNAIFVILKRTTRDMEPRSFDVTGLVDDEKLGNETIMLEGYLTAEELGYYAKLEWEPNSTGKYRIKVNVSSEITDIDVGNNAMEVEVEVLEPPYGYANLGSVPTPSPPKFSPPWCSMAACAKGEDPHDKGWFNERMKRYIYRCFEYDTAISLRHAGGWAIYVLGIVASGEDPRDFGGINYLGMMKSYYNGKSMGNEETGDVVWDDAMTLLALGASGEDKSEQEMVENVIEDLLNRQNNDSSWEFTYESKGTASDTAIVIQALIASGVSKDSGAIKNGLSYLKSVQNDDGSFPYRTEGSKDVLATSHAVQAILAAAENPRDWAKNPVDYLNDSQPVQERYLFSIGNASGLESDLNNGTIPESLNVTFEANNYPLTGNAEVTKEDDNLWIITDGGKEYALIKEDDKLDICRREKVLGANAQAARIPALLAEPYPVAKLILREKPRPDLCPTLVEAPYHIYRRTDCTIDGVIRNNGGAIDATLLANGVPVANSTVTSVWAKGRTEIHFRWRPEAAGEYNLSLVCDYFNEINETDETNNIRTIFVEVEYPDLYIKEKDMNLHSNTMNMTNIMDVTVHGTTDESFDVAFLENNRLIEEKRVHGIDGSEELMFNWTPRKVGRYELTVVVDSKNEVMEGSKEWNNKLTKQVMAIVPELYVNMLDIPTIYANATNPIYLDIGGAASAFNVSLFANGMLVDKQGIESKWAEEDLKMVLHWKPNQTGLYDVRVFVDSDNDVDEIDETNNNETQQVNVILPDLIPVEIKIPEYVYYNETNELNVTITGAGDGFNVTLIASGGYIYDNATNATVNETTNASLNATVIGRLTNVSFYGNTSLIFNWVPHRIGMCNLTVLVDPDNDLFESNEINNNLTKAVHVVDRVPIVLLAPIGGEVWKNVENIKWKTTYKKDLTIDIDYSPNKGRTWANIVRNTADDGVHAWDTNSVADGYDYLILVMASGEDAYGEDTSNLFTIYNSGSAGSSAGIPDRFSMSTAPDSASLLWVSDEIGANPGSSLAVADGKIFVYCTGSSGGYVVCLDEDTSVELWRAGTGEWTYGSWATPAYSKGKVYMLGCGDVPMVVGYDKNGDPIIDYFPAVALYTIDANSGSAGQPGRYVVAHGEIGCQVNGGVLAAYGTQFFGTYDNMTYYRVGNRCPKPCWLCGGYDWAFKVEGNAMSTPAAGYDSIYFGSHPHMAPGTLYRVEQSTGEEIWSLKLKAEIGCSPTVAKDGNVYVTTYGYYERPSGLYAVDALEGDIEWYKETPPSSSTPAHAPFGDGYVYIAGGGGKGLVDNFVACYDARNGREIWYDDKSNFEYWIKDKNSEYDNGIGHWTNSPGVSVDKKVFVGKPMSKDVTDYMGLFCLDAFTGKERWHSDYGGSTVAIANGRVYTTGDGKVYAFGPTDFPDLIVESINTSEEIWSGVPTKIEVMVKNIGAADEEEKLFNVSLRYEDGEIGVVEKVASLNKGENKTVEFWWIPDSVSKEEIFELQADVNPDKSVNEGGPYQYENNRRLKDVTVYPMLPDIEVTGIKAANRMDVDKPYTISANIINNGSICYAFFNVRFRVYPVDDEANIITEASLPVLEVLSYNQTKTLSFGWTPTATGNYTLEVFADAYDAISESNETNNIDTVIIEVKKEEEEEPELPELPAPKRGWGSGPGGGGGTGGGFGGGTGTGTGTGNESGTGGETEINASSSLVEGIKNVIGHPFGTGGSKGGGGGGSLYLYLLLLLLLITTFLYLGYYKEKRAHAKQVFPGAYRRNRNKK